MIRRIPRARRRGSMLPLVAVCAIGLFSFVALAIDLGMLAVSRTQCQNAADAAALAGARTLNNKPGVVNNDLQKAVATAKATATANEHLATNFTGAQVATLRALIVVALWMTAHALARPLRFVDALGAAALLLLAWSPEDLADPAFQLSFVAALTLAVIPREPERLGTPRPRIVRWLVRGIIASVWVSLASSAIAARTSSIIRLAKVDPSDVRPRFAAP